MKPDENALMKIIRAGGAPEQAILLCGIPEKRVWYILDKWTDKGWWEYGVSLRTGWLTDMGKVAAEMEVV